MTTATQAFDSLWFSERIEATGLSQREVSERLCSASGKPMHQASLCRTLKGARRLQLSEARELADLFEVPLAEVLRHAGIRTRDADDDIEKRHAAALKMVRSLLGVLDEHGVPLAKRVRAQAEALE